MAAFNTIVGNAKAFFVMRDEATGKEYGLSLDISNPMLISNSNSYGIADITISGTVVSDEVVDLSHDKHEIEEMTYESV